MIGLTRIPAPQILQTQLTALPERQQVVAVVLATSLIVLVIELVRRRKLREEYSWVWVAVALLLLALATDDTVIVALSGLIGSATATSTLFFGAILFLLLLALQFSVRLSRLTHRQRTLAQRVALLEQELELARRKPPAEIVPLRTPPAVPTTVQPRAQDGSA